MTDLPTLRAMRDRLIIEINAGKKGCREKRRQLSIIVAGIMAHGMKKGDA